MKEKSHITDTDRRISAMLKGEDKGAPRDEWFVRKTLNRLPDRRSRVISLPEFVAFLIVMTASAIIIGVQLHQALTTDPPAFNPYILLMAALSALTATIYIAIPILKRS